MRITDRNDWFELWFEDRQSILETMIRNMRADLDAGYNYFGNSIQKQIAMIQNYKETTDKQLDQFKTMEETTVNRWCYYEMKKHGIIG